MATASFGMLPRLQARLARLVDAVLGPDVGAVSPSHVGPALGPYRIVATAPDQMEIEDRAGARSSIPLSLGARTTLAGALRQHGLKSPLGLTIRREPFDVDGAIFYRWAVDAPPAATRSASKAEAAAVC
jgi:hypothetical protein